MRFFVVLFFFLSSIFWQQEANAELIKFQTDNITVNGCSISVYKAATADEQMAGMLGFTDDTFKNDGMIFLGEKYRTHYFHTIGMEMNIYIMGVTKVGDKTYKIEGKPIYAKSGIDSIQVNGQSILEVPAKLFDAKLLNCFTSKK